MFSTKFLGVSALCLAAAPLLTVLACADTVILVSGREMHGQIIEQTEEFVRIESSEQVYKLGRKFIREVRSDTLQTRPENPLIPNHQPEPSPGPQENALDLSVDYIEGKRLFDLWRHYEAAKLFRKVLARQPDHYEATRDLSIALSILNEKRLAQPYIEKAWALNAAKIAEEPQEFGHLLDRIKLLLAKEDYATAGLQLKKAIPGAPQQSEYYRIQGSLAMIDGQYSVALENYAKAIDLNKENWGAYYLTAAVQDLAGQNDAAIKTAERLIERNPEFMDAYNFLAGLLLDRKEDQAANKYIQRMADRSPDFLLGQWVQFVSINQTQEKTRDFKVLERKLLQELKSWETAGVYNILAGVYAFVEQDQNAENAYLNGLKVDGDHSALNLDYGNFLSSAKRWQEALPLIRKAVKLEPLDFQTHFGLGVILSQTGDWSGAMESFKTAHDLAPGNYFTQVNLAKCYLNQKDYALAQTILEQAIQQAPESWQAFDILAALYEQKRDWVKGNELRVKALALAPNELDLKAALGFNLLMQGRNDEASVYFEEVYAVNPDHTMANVNLGMSRLAQNRLDEAKRYLDKALVLQPEDFLANLIMGKVLLAQGQWDPAQVFLDKAEKMNAEDYELQFSQGVVKMQARRLPEAIAHFHKALELNPHDGDACMFLSFALGHQGAYLPSRDAGIKAYRILKKEGRGKDLRTLKDGLLPFMPLIFKLELFFRFH